LVHGGWIGHTSSGDGKRTSHALDLLLVDERRVCSVSDIDALALGQEASDVLAAKAVSDGTDLLRALLLHVCQRLLDNRVDLVGQVALALRAALLQPGHDVEVLGAVELDGVALEEIGHDDEVAVGGELVGDELGVDELMADHVGEDDDGGGGVLGLGEGDVGGDLGGWLDWDCVWVG
jgi:hypothetical protein